jgi:hypothetical protein
VLSYTQVAKVMQVVEKIAEQPAIAPLVAGIIEDKRQRMSWNKETIKSYFNELAAVMTYEENNPKQEQQVN